MEKMFNITGLTVFYKTPDLIDISLKPFKKFYPNTPLVIVNNSPEDDECTIELLKFAKNYLDDTLVIQLDMNYGHGPGLNRGMEYIDTPYVYIFDSDVEILRGDLLEDMLGVMTPGIIYGTGFTRLTSRGGSHRDEGNLTDPEVMTYLHPLACLISTEQYNKFPKFNSGGAPFSNAMSAIKDTGFAQGLIKFFPVHLGRVKYIKHHGGTTRARYGICSSYKGE